MKTFVLAVCVIVMSVGAIAPVVAADEPAVSATPTTMDRKQDVIYGRLPGVALTMDVFTPGGEVKQNGAAVIWVVSGGWASAHETIDAKLGNMSLADSFIQPVVKRGYTVFAVVHASQPKYTITEILPQINRAVRYIRANAKAFGIDPDRIGIVGASAGGHLSLMQGISPQPPSDKAQDPVDRVSSKVQAVAAFVPPTDFLNYGSPGVNALGQGPLGWLKAPFDFHEARMVPSLIPNQQQVINERIIEPVKLMEIGKAISPIYHVDKDDAPTLIVHGEVDRLVPVQQAQSLKTKLDEAKVPSELFVREKADHWWPEMTQDMEKVADWFDKYLKKG